MTGEASASASASGERAGSSTPSTPSTPSSSIAGSNGVRIDRILATIVGAFSLAFAVQTLPAIVDQWSELRLVPTLLVLGAYVVGSVGVIVSGVFSLPTRPWSLAVVASIIVGLLLWPALLEDPDRVIASVPWIWYLATIGTAFAALSLPLRVAVACGVLVPVVYAVVRTLPSGGSVDPRTALVDGGYVAIVGGVMITIIVSLRHAAARVDAVQETAMAEYESAVRHHANEVERVEVDALVHDSVLATFLAAASAESDAQRSLAATMATTALENLVGTSDDGYSHAYVGHTLIVRQLQHASDALGARFTADVGPGRVPRAAAEALVGASWQALTNSVQHAGPATQVTRTVVATLTSDGVVVSVEDDGAGFDVSRVPAERLGIRLSIVDRMRSVGGRALVRSVPGTGTTVIVRWNAAASERTASRSRGGSESRR